MHAHDREEQEGNKEGTIDGHGSLANRTAPGGSHAFDFKTAFSYDAMSEEERTHYWDDAVHFTPAGYDLMGEQIATALIGILKAEDNAAAGPQTTTLSAVRPRKRKIFPDDDKDFEEEQGRADELRRGYVVVRRKDLD